MESKNREYKIEKATFHFLPTRFFLMGLDMLHQMTSFVDNWVQLPQRNKGPTQWALCHKGVDQQIPISVYNGDCHPLGDHQSLVCRLQTSLHLIHVGWFCDLQFVFHRTFFANTILQGKMVFPKVIPSIPVIRCADFVIPTMDVQFCDNIWKQIQKIGLFQCIPFQSINKFGCGPGLSTTNQMILRRLRISSS